MTTTPTATQTPAQKASFDAYYAGRNSWYPGERVPRVNPYAGTAYAADFARGLQSVLAEERLNLCTEWDGE